MERPPKRVTKVVTKKARLKAAKLKEEATGVSDEQDGLESILLRARALQGEATTKFNVDDSGRPGVHHYV